MLPFTELILNIINDMKNPMVAIIKYAKKVNAPVIVGLPAANSLL